MMGCSRMIRFVDLKNQIIKEENCFCFYDLVEFEMVSLSGNDTFDDEVDFIGSYNASGITKPSLGEFLKLIPDRYLRKNIEYSKSN